MVDNESCEDLLRTITMSRSNDGNIDNDNFRPIHVSDSCIIGQRPINSLYSEHIIVQSNTREYNILAAKSQQGQAKTEKVVGVCGNQDRKFRPVSDSDGQVSDIIGNNEITDDAFDDDDTFLQAAAEIKAKPKNFQTEHSKTENFKTENFNTENSIAENLKTKNSKMIVEKKSATNAAIIIIDSDDDEMDMKVDESFSNELAAISEKYSETPDSIEALFDEPTIHKKAATEMSFELGFYDIDQADNDHSSGTSSPILTSSFRKFPNTLPEMSPNEDDFTEPLPDLSNNDDFDEPLPQVTHEFEHLSSDDFDPLPESLLNTGIAREDLSDTGSDIIVPKRKSTHIHLDNEAVCNEQESDDEFDDSFSGIWM